MQRVLALVLVLGCGGGGGGSAMQPAPGGAGGVDAQSSAGGALAGAGGAAGATVVADAGPRASGGSGGSGGSAGSGAIPDAAPPVPPTPDANRLPTPDAAPPTADAPVPVPFMCAGMHVANGIRPPGCVHPAIAFECRSTDPSLFPTAPCNLSIANLYMAMCILETWPCMADDQCCGSHLSGDMPEKKCAKDAPGDFFGHCR